MKDEPMTATELKRREAESATVWAKRCEELVAPIIERIAKVLEQDKR